jgi:hypothetical protein
MFSDMPAPPGAVVLFGGKGLENWTTPGGGAAKWKVEDGAMTVNGTGNIMTKEKLTDFLLHLEFWCPNMPKERGQGKANSGIFLQGRYEIQVLDSFGLGTPGKGDCGAIYNQFAPLLNACLPPEHWQTFDVIFRSARVDADGKPVENARITVLQNGRVIHNNAQTTGVCGGALDTRVGEPGPLMLQDHGNPVRYRNIWAVPLPLKGSDRYEPGG